MPEFPQFDLAGRVAIVSGAASGLGKAVATALAGAGADLLLPLRQNRDGMAATVADVERLGRRAVVVPCDVSVPEELDELYAVLDREYGRLDILFNVAGSARMAPPESISLDDVRYALQNLVIGRFYCCQLAGRRMLAAGKGSIVNIGSIASVTAQGRNHIAYSMAMGAVVQMTRELSTEWCGRGVRVNAILPAQVPNLHMQVRFDADPSLRDKFLRGIPMGRLGTNEDIMGLAVFLASDASSWISGALIPLDGGNLAKNAGGSHPGMPVA